MSSFFQRECSTGFQAVDIRDGVGTSDDYDAVIDFIEDTINIAHVSLYVVADGALVNLFLSSHAKQVFRDKTIQFFKAHHVPEIEDQNHSSSKA